MSGLGCCIAPGDIDALLGVSSGVRGKLFPICCGNGFCDSCDGA